MTITSQQYAELAQDSYDTNRTAGVRTAENPEWVTLKGIRYQVLEHCDNPRTGYQGTIYLREGTNELVVAHRGTEFPREPLQDGLIADGGMVFNRTNSQAPEALALTQRAIDRAKEMASDKGYAPEVTVTGHSLGGTLAQITAAKLDLRGEAFNPYGAVSLNYGVPEGGHRFVNHVMAGDTVSAASPHYGQLRMYATPKEVAAITAAGYGRLNPIPDNPLAAAGIAMTAAGSHYMDNFLPVDSKKRIDISVLDDPASRKLAEQFSGAFGDYRRDIRMLRGGISLGGDALKHFNDAAPTTPPPPPQTQDWNNFLRNAPLGMQEGSATPGAKAQPDRVEQIQEGSQLSVQSLASQTQTLTPPIPDHLRDFRHPEHPQHGRYQGVLQEVHRMEERGGIPSGPHSEQMAAALVDKLGKEDRHFALDRLEMRGQDVVAVQRRDNYFEAQRELSLNADQALSRPVEQVSADWAKRTMPHLGQPRPALEQANAFESRQPAVHDLRHPDQMRQGQRDSLREQVADTYTKAGIVRSEAQLERATTAIALDMQRYGLDRADHLYLLTNRDGTIGPESGIGAQQGSYPLQLRSQTSGEALQQAPEENYQQVAQAAQQQTMEQQQRQATAQGSQSGGLSMG